ncbi:DUF885 domain-containing protein [Exilibacterium tricleocarpae]|uniref:DUF885 domain-containing protein n=1 Tax=Exilibacterium tricleocarpae TaxID=2591008 RepID=A0A545T5X7_9GAMM|nr:DUF885 domain-containing protein [Exilibacterium tricleocarpae]TQV72640.1 DUF885 domain-containing protein [Exilibacterium tricleocarpae]
MMKLRTALAALGVAALLTACDGGEAPAAELPQAATDQSAAFLAMTEEQAKTFLRRAPLFATSLGVSADYLGEKFSDRLGDFSVAAVAENKAANAEFLAALDKFDSSRLQGTAATTYDVLKTSLQMAAEFKPYVHGAYNPLGIFSPYPVTQISGPHISLPRALQTQHPLTSEADAEDYLTRLGQIQQALADTAAVVRADADQGVLPPGFALEGAINTIAQMTAPAPATHPLVESFDQRLQQVDSVTAERRRQLVARAATLVETGVYPGYAALRAALEELRPRATDDPGIWALPDGEKRYQLALESFGAAGKTAAEVHALGQREVERIQAEMDRILKAQGYAEGSVIERYIALSQEPRFIYPNTDAGRQELLAGLNAQMEQIAGLLPDILLTLPKAGVEVRRIAEYEQDGAPGGYYTGPSLDGSRPGIYWINLKDTADWPKFTLPTLTYHEASPGHHLQVAIAQEIDDLPMIRNMLWYSEYGEGWALYAEVLAQELGLYDEDPFGDLGRLQSELFRAARLVVDTGLHYKKWTRQQAIDYLHGATGETLAAVTREVERYAVWPGQACSYKLGQLKILELRARARQRLGERFDLRAFNDQLLIRGAVPLPVLEANIEQWIDSVKS